jgi:membrane protein DedA with SNARE-associated domain
MSPGGNRSSAEQAEEPVPHDNLVYELLGWFLFLLSAAVGNPIPEEIVIISGGIRAAQMTDDYGPWRWLMWPTCTLGALVADLLLYGIGRLFGEVVTRSRLLSKLAHADKQERIRENLHRYGVAIFVIGRLVPGIRTTLFLTAGTIRLPLWKFIVADGIGGLFGTSLFFWLGYLLGAQFRELIEEIDKEISPYKTIILVVLVSVAGAYLLYRYLSQPISTGDPEEVPLIGHQIATHLPVSPPETPAGQAEQPRAENQSEPAAEKTLGK